MERDRFCILSVYSQVQLEPGQSCGTGVTNHPGLCQARGLVECDKFSAKTGMVPRWFVVLCLMYSERIKKAWDSQDSIEISKRLSLTGQILAGQERGVFLDMGSFYCLHIGNKFIKYF